MMRGTNRPDVILVDDEESIRETLRSVLEEIGITVIEASNGRHAISLILEQHPRVVVSDIKMPNMNGYELFNNLRKEYPDHAKTKFVFLTGLADTEFIKAAYRIGVDDFISKPVDIRSFQRKISDLLRDEAASGSEISDLSDVDATENSPKRAESEQAVRDLLEANGKPVPLGQVFCIGINEIRRRVGDAKWRKLKDRVANLISDAVRKVCRPDDVYLKCPDGSVVIVFADNDAQRCEAVAAKAATIVNKALFGSDDLAGAEVRSLVQIANDTGSGRGKSAGKILDTLLASAKRLDVAPPAQAVAGNHSDTRQKNSNTRTALSSAAETPANTDVKHKDTTEVIPSFRSELLQKFTMIESSPIEFSFMPVWSVSQRRVEMFNCVPTRQAAGAADKLWNYAVLGNTPKISDICDLDLATLEYGMLAAINHINRGIPVSLCPNFHYETLAGKKSREKVQALLQLVPDHLRQFIYPIIMHIPEGITEARLRDITGQVRNYTNVLAAEIFPRKASSDLGRTVSRLRSGGIDCLMVRLSRTYVDQEVAWVKQISDRIRKQGGKAGVSGIRNATTLIELAYSSLEYCSGLAIGGPYDTMPEPFPFDGKKLEV